MPRYMVRTNESDCLEVYKPLSSVLVYRVPYSAIKEGTHGLEISNRFIVYILHERNHESKDKIYVGKSKNGIDNRPTSHENKSNRWSDCYILTTFQEKTFLNDGSIQYIEDAISHRIDEIPHFENLTNQTNRDTANTTEVEDCREFLDDVYYRLKMLGLDLYPVQSEDDMVPDTPSGGFQINESNRPLYEELVGMVGKVNSDITATVMKVYIKFELDGNLLFSIDQRKDFLLLYLNADPDRFSDPRKLIEPAFQGHHGVGHSKIKIADSSDFDYIANLINQRINM